MLILITQPRFKKKRISLWRCSEQKLNFLSIKDWTQQKYSRHNICACFITTFSQLLMDIEMQYTNCAQVPDQTIQNSSVSKPAIRWISSISKYWEMLCCVGMKLILGTSPTDLFHNLPVSKSTDRRTLCSSGTQYDGFWSYKFVKKSVVEEARNMKTFK